MILKSSLIRADEYIRVPISFSIFHTTDLFLSLALNTDGGVAWISATARAQANVEDAEALRVRILDNQTGSFCPPGIANGVMSKGQTRLTLFLKNQSIRLDPFQVLD